MRLGGIASGMDTEKMVKELMNAEKVRVNKYYRQQESIKWKQEALNTTNKVLADFILKARSGFGLTSTSNTGSIINRGTDSFDWVKKASSSNESLVKATATANAMEGQHTLEVLTLAEVARFTSGKLDLNSDGTFKSAGSFTIKNGTTDPAKKIEVKIENAKVIGGELQGDLNFAEGNALVLDINGTKIKIDEDFTQKGDPQQALLEHIENALGGQEIIVEAEDGKLKFTSTNPEKAITINVTAEKEDLSAEDKAALVSKLGLKNGTTKGTTISDVVKQINDSDVGLRASYDSKVGKLMITSKAQGSDQSINFDAFTGTLDSTLFTGPAAKNEAGSDAKFWFNAGELTEADRIGEVGIIKQSSNNFTLYGINIQLQNIQPGNKVTINVESNVDGVMDKVKGFVEEYNALIDVLNGLLKEKTHKGYTPLIQEEREAMKDKEIELWEAKAKSGLLNNDATITRMLQNMRSGLYENVHGGWKTGEDKNDFKLSGFSHITQIGITTGNYQSGGKLEIDEAKLRQAIIDNPDGVVNLLFKKPESTNVKSPDGKIDGKLVAEKRANSGLVERLFDDMITGMQDIVRRSGTGDNASLYRSVQSNMLIDFVTSGSISLLDKDLTSVGSRITREESLLVSKETRYWNQFTAMEKAMQKMNSQSSWLSAQMGM